MEHTICVILRLLSVEVLHTDIEYTTVVPPPFADGGTDTLVPYSKSESSQLLLCNGGTSTSVPCPDDEHSQQLDDSVVVDHDSVGVYHDSVSVYHDAFKQHLERTYKRNIYVLGWLSANIQQIPRRVEKELLILCRNFWT